MDEEELEEKLKNENIDIDSDIEDDEIEINKDEDDNEFITKKIRATLHTIAFCAWGCAVLKYGITNPLVIISLVILIMI